MPIVLPIVVSFVLYLFSLFCDFHRYFRLCHFEPTTQPLWLVGTSGKKIQIPLKGDLAKTTAVGI